MSKKPFNSVSVVIGTYGNRDEWQPLVDRAMASAWNQTVPPCEVIHSHGNTLAQARNDGAKQATGTWLIFLDADDELDEKYIEAMLAADGDLRRPATLGVVDGVEDDEPVMLERKPLLSGNYIVIGAMHRKLDFEVAGGFYELPRLEDWELWIRLSIQGAEIVDVPDAIYRVHVRQESRNQGDHLHGKVYSEVRQTYGKYRGKGNAL